MAAEQQCSESAGKKLAPPAAVDERPHTLKILFVEDDEFIRMAALDMLAELGHEVFAAGDAKAALWTASEQRDSQ